MEIIMTRSWIWQLLGVLALPLCVALVPQATSQVQAASIHFDGWDQLYKVVDEVNAERRKAGLQPVKFEGHLQDDAWRYASVCARLDRYNGTSHNMNGSLGTRAQASGYKGRAVWENLAWGQENAKQVMYGPGWCWMNSPGHRANILAADARDVGIAFWRSKSGHLYWVLVLGKP
jgi:uncharacterized protein YkwD